MSRAMGLPQKEYKDKVLEFLEPEDDAKLSDTWEDQQLFAVELVEALLRLPPSQSNASDESTEASEEGME